MEFCDRNFGRDDLDAAGFQCRIAPGYVVDLVPDEDQLFRNMRSKSARYAIRKATKLGVVVEEARDEGFADDYHAQLVDVFANQGLIPTYGKERVRLLMRHLLPTGNLLLLRARSPEGRCIATGIFLGMNQCAYFWGNASWRQDRHFCPNEPLHWYAMCHWMRRGLRYYDMCGGGVYKRKYGGRPVETCYFRKSRFRWIAAARNVAGQAYRLYQRAALLPRRIRSTEKDNQGSH